MAWLILFLAGLLEIAWAVGLKYTEGFTRLWPSVFTVLAMIASFFLLAQALRSIPVGTGYAVWTGIGVIGTTLFGLFLFREPATAGRMVCIALIVAGIIGLRFFSGQNAA